MHATNYQGTWVHWDIASSKVGQPSSEVTGRLLRKFPLTRAAAHCAIGQAHVLQQPRLSEHRLWLMSRRNSHVASFQSPESNPSHQTNLALYLTCIGLYI